MQRGAAKGSAGITFIQIVFLDQVKQVDDAQEPQTSHAGREKLQRTFAISTS